MQKKRKKKLGFTLIEILVVMTLSVIITMAATTLFYTTLVGNSKRQVLTVVKEEGDYALGQMEFMTRNAISLAPDPQNPALPVCSSNMNRFTVKEADDGVTTFSIANGRIASQSAANNTPIYLTSTAVTPSSLTFNCSQVGSSFGTYVNISFALQKQSYDVSQPTTVNDTFSTGVNIRSL